MSNTGVPGRLEVTEGEYVLGADLIDCLDKQPAPVELAWFVHSEWEQGSIYSISIFMASYKARWDCCRTNMDTPSYLSSSRYHSGSKFASCLL